MKPQAAASSVFSRQLCSLSACAVRVQEIPVLRAAAAKVTRHLPSLAERDVATRDYSVVCGVLRGSLREHPYRRSPKLHFANFQINYPLDLLQELGCEKYKCIFTFFTMSYRYLTNTKLMHIRYDVRIRTYIQTDTACVHHVNCGAHSGSLQ